MPELASIVLAAGQGKRMRSARPKPLHRLCGKPLLSHVLAALRPLGPQPQVVVIGVGAEQVQAETSEPDVAWAVQEEQLGTGHAAACAREVLCGFTGDLLVTCADIPLVRTATWEHVLREHRESGAAATIVTALFDDPTGYGRVLRNAEGLVQRIVEESDCDEATRAVREGNVSLYAFQAPVLWAALETLMSGPPATAQGEYYLTDVVEVLVREGQKVIAVVAEEQEVMGINDRLQLAQAERIMRKRLNRRAMLEFGVTLVDPDHTYLGPDVTIGQDTVIYPGAVVQGNTHIGPNCLIGPHVFLEDSEIGEGSEIRHGSVVRDSVVGRRVTIGPFAHIRDHSSLGEGTRVGGGEVVRSRLGARVNDLHFSYLGDATVGDGANIGAGAITCNYDGQRKNPTIIEDGAFIGSDACLIAPVTIGRDAYVAAGSVITKDVPPEALAIGRARQENREGWARKMRK